MRRWTKATARRGRYRGRTGAAGAAARGLSPALGCNGRPGSPGLPLLRLRTPTYDPGGGVFAVLVVVPIPVPDVVKRAGIEDVPAYYRTRSQYSSLMP